MLWCASDRRPIVRTGAGLYIFVSRDRVRAKVLHWDGTGLYIDAKRLRRAIRASLA
jgi:hypothetical protein